VSIRPPAPPPSGGRAPAALALARDAFGREIPEGGAPSSNDQPPPQNGAAPAKREAATDALGRRVGALLDEVAFPEFVASLVHGTFDAIVDSSIRQMESFADLVAAVAKPLEQFQEENVTLNQARDYLAEQYSRDIALVTDGSGPTLEPRARTGQDEEAQSPAWLADFGLRGEALTPDLIEEQLLPKARELLARKRLQTLSTMVLLGMNRVVVKDGEINAAVRIRAAAADTSKFDYATDGGAQQNASEEWGQRGSRAYAAPRAMVATVGINAQSDSNIAAEISGKIRINFASETVPLDRFLDEQRRTQLERHARPAVQPAPAQPSAAALPAPVVQAPVAAAPVAVPVAAAPPPSSGAPQ